MKSVLLSVTLLMSPLAAHAQTTPAPAQTPPPSAGQAAGTLNGDTPIATIMADPAGKAALTKQFPEIPGHAAYEQFKGMSLRDLAPLAGGIISDEKIAAFETEMKSKK